MTRQRRLITAASATAASVLLLAGCAGGGGNTAAGPVELEYWVWDSNQQPGYEECTAAFTEANPDITVNTTQYGWNDYWSTLTTGLVSGDGPDIFVNHLSYYPGLAARGQLLPLDDAVEAAGVDLSIYREGLADLWVGLDGSRYGLPKDYDTVAVFANQAFLDEAGISQEQLDTAEWNPEDGGTWEQIIARLTVDTNGVRGDEPGFDRTSIAVYGLGLNASGGGNGQTEWSQYAFSNDWTHADQNPWGEQFNYDAPEFIETITWFQSLAEKGYMPTLQIASSGIGQVDAYGAGRYAMVTEGSWNTQSYFALDGVETALAPVPAGPNGERASMFNGLADSVAATTDHPEEARELAIFLASQECQDITAAKGIAFPAVEASAEISREAFVSSGIDIAAFQVPIDEGSTYLAPVAENWAELQAIMAPTMDAILSLEADPSTLVDANEQVNALFQ